MLEIALVAFTTFFATMGPIDVAAIFAALTSHATQRDRRAMAIKGILVAAAILMAFVLFGNQLLKYLGITLPALRTAGGILLLLIAIEMVFARSSGSTSTTDEETREAGRKQDISVFPLATPLVAGPGAMGASILLMAETHGDMVHQLIVVGALVANLTITFVLLLGATQVHRLLGVTALNVISRVVGILLAALAVQFIFDGIGSSGLFTPGLAAG